MPKQTKVITLTMPLDIYEKITKEAEAVNRPRTSYLRQMIHLYYQHLEQRPDCEKSLKVR